MNKNFFLKKSYVYLRRKNKNNSEIVSQIIYGEKFKIIKKINNWFKIKNSYDGYTGYIKKQILLDNFKPSHKIVSLRSFVFKKNKNLKYIKTNKSLPFASKVMIINSGKKFSEFQKNLWLNNKDIVEINYIEKNFQKVLKLFLNTKYKWGGKIYNGIDCSGLLQIFFQFNNIFVPRDTKDQIKFFRTVKFKNNFQKGTLIFWKGHIAICLNNKFLIHAFGPKKKVVIMNIKKTIDEIKKKSNLVVIGIKKINAFRKKR